MLFAMTTDFRASSGSPDEDLQLIAEAGWSWLHWCHHWNDDFLYGPAEMRHLTQKLKDLGLRILDIHGSAGREKCWDSSLEYERQAGVELVRNRLEMAAQVGCDVLIMHPAYWPAEVAVRQEKWDAFRRSMDELLPVSRKLGVCIALENMAMDNFDLLDRCMETWAASEVGICYDPGHGNIAKNGLERLARQASRLLAIHLNDNDSHADQHRPLFTGTVDWNRLAEIFKMSGYNRPAISVEVESSKLPAQEVPGFLKVVKQSAERFGQMLV